MNNTIRCSLSIVKYTKTYNHSTFVALNNNFRKCYFSKSSVFQKKSHYDVLGITPKATQTDVKTAYYKLSMIYHPDKNKGCADAADKFRDINFAYEILGNYKLRRLYDKGIVHTAGPQYRDVEETVEEPDDPQTKFYKQHMKRSETPYASGRKPIFNFDEWNSAHYGKSFERSQAARKKFRDKPKQEKHAENSLKYEILIFGCMVGVTIVLYLAVLYDDATVDQTHSRVE